MRYATNSLDKFFNPKQYPKLFSISYLLGISFLIYYLVEFQSKAISPNYFVLILTFTVFMLISEIIILDDKYRFLLLSKIYFFALFLHYIFVIPNYELFGYDGYSNFSLMLLLNSDSNLHIGIPNLQILFIILGNITNINLLFLIKYVPSIYTSISVVFVYLISKLFFGNKPSLLSSLLYSSVHYFAMFHSWFICEGLSFLLSLILTYIIVKQSAKIEYSILIFILILSLVFSHHLTPFLMFIFLVLAYCTNFILNYFYNDSRIYTLEKSRLSIIMQLFITMLLSYWIYNYFVPIYQILEPLIDSTPSATITQIVFRHTRYFLIRKYGYWLIVFIFGSLTTLNLYNFIIKITRSPIDSKKYVFFIPMYIYSYLLSIFYLLGSYSIITTNVALNRLFTFSWVFLLILGIPYVFIKKHSTIFVFLIGLYFILFNVLFLFPHYAYSPYNSELVGKDEIDFRVPQSQVYSEKWSNLSGSTVTGTNGINILSKNRYQFNRSFVSVIDSESNLEILQGNFSQISQYNWIYIYSDMYNNINIGNSIPLSKNYTEIIGLNDHIDLVYQNNNNTIYKIK